MTEYNPAIIQKLADKLYKQANTVVFVCTLIGVLVGGGVGYAAGRERDRQIYAIVGAILVGIIGFAVGLSQSFMLRVRAQMALCQRKIEENTRRT
jgi:outer membrane lipoprotein SlyB